MAKNRKDYKLKVEWVDIDKVIPYPRNTKKHPPEQVQKIVANIYANGFDQPITVDKEMVIITGHGRHMAAKELKLAQVPVIIRSDLSEHEVMAKRIADNKLNESDWDEEFLGFEMQTLFSANEIDMDMTGFGEKELKKLIDIGEVNSEQIGDNGGGVDQEGEQQFLVTIHCKDESMMQDVYDEMRERGYDCTLMR